MTPAIRRHHGMQGTARGEIQFNTTARKGMQPSTIANEVMNTASIERKVVMDDSKVPDGQIIWNQYEDALFEIAKLREELHTKNSQIESLTETIMQMSLELATAKAKQDELSMKLRISSSVDESLVEKAAAEEKSRVSSRRSSRRGSRPNIEHSASIAVQNPSTERRLSNPCVPRHKSDSWALRRSEVDEETEVESNFDGSLRRLAGFRLGWGLEGELRKSSRENRTSESSDDSTDARGPPNRQNSRRGIGSLVRSLSGTKNDISAPTKKSSHASSKQVQQPTIKEGGVTSFSSSLRGKNTKRIERSELKISRVVFPEGSSDMLTAFFEESGNLNMYKPPQKNAEWGAM